MIYFVLEQDYNKRLKISSHGFLWKEKKKLSRHFVALVVKKLSQIYMHREKKALIDKSATTFEKKRNFFRLTDSQRNYEMRKCELAR